MMKYIYCHPLFEERKSAHRFAWQLERRFEEANRKLTRFDYQCTGEETGQFCDVSIDSLIADIDKIADAGEIVLIGLRLGATLAFLFTLKNPGRVKKLIMISPVINGSNYIEYLIRKQKIKNIMTDNIENSPSDHFINIEGYKTSQLLLEQIKKINPTKYDLDSTNQKNSISILNTINSMTNNTEISEFVESLQKKGFKANSKSIEFPPIWERIGHKDCTPLADSVMELCYD